MCVCNIYSKFCENILQLYLAIHGDHSTILNSQCAGNHMQLINCDCTTTLNNKTVSSQLHTFPICVYLERSPTLYNHTSEGYFTYDTWCDLWPKINNELSLNSLYMYVYFNPFDPLKLAFRKHCWKQRKCW